MNEAPPRRMPPQAAGPIRHGRTGARGAWRGRPLQKPRRSAPGDSLAVNVMRAAAVYYVLLLLDNALLRRGEEMSSYIDEFAVLLAAPFLFAIIFRPPAGLASVAVGAGTYFAAGIISGLFSPVAGYPFLQVTGLTVALDAKPFIILVAFAYCLQNARSSDVVTPFLYGLIAVALLNFPFVLRDLAINDGFNIFGEPMDSRAGIFRPHGLFHHASASVDITLLGAMAASVLWVTRKTATMAALTAFLALTIMLHLVAKEIVAVVVVLGISVLCIRFRDRNTQILVRALAAVAGILLAVPFASLVLPIIAGQVTDYVGDAESAVRSLMYLISIDLADRYMPLGTGIGTFGSLASYTTFYSPIYDQTGLALIYGASRAYPYYLQDVFWPKVLGESGWIGLAGYLGLQLFLAGRVLIATFRQPTAESLLAALILVTALIKSPAAPTYTSDLYVVVLGYAMAVAACYPRGFAEAARRRQARQAQRASVKRPALRRPRQAPLRRYQGRP